MSQRESLVQTGIDRVRTTVESTVNGANKELRRVQKRLESQRKTFEKRFASQRKALEKRAQGLVSQVRENPLIQRAEAIREGATRQLEATVETVLAAFPIATRSDVERIDRKISQLSRKLKEIEKDGAAA
jgi:hypothetical protein